MPQLSVISSNRASQQSGCIFTSLITDDRKLSWPKWLLTLNLQMVTKNCPWVGLTHGLGWVGSSFFSFGGLGWVKYSKSGKMWKDYVSAFKARLNKICCTKQLVVLGLVGLGPADGMGWIGSHKVDPWTALWSPIPINNRARCGATSLMYATPLLV